MSRLIVISFIFMGLAFYHLSGGADYKPAPNSIQARSAQFGVFAAFKPGNTVTSPPSENQDSLSLVLADLPRSDASNTQTTTTPSIKVNAFPPLTQTKNTAPSDIHYISGETAAIRTGPGLFYEEAAKLPQGTEVTVLQTTGDGWLKIEALSSGETGWTVTWMVTDSAN